MPANLTVIEHPLVADKIARLRDVDTDPALFRRLCQEVTVLTAYEALRDLSTKTTTVETPITTADVEVLAGPEPAVVGILRAGLIMVEAILSLVPEARVGHIGLFRDPETHQPVEYYRKLPPALDQREIILVDPMLATGGSAAAAITQLKEAGAQRVRLISIIGCPEGVAAVHAQHPDVAITLAALDERLNEKAYIVPGLGDAGDRIYGTL
ncbi:MAG: uracil phosphoribosyltransferase [Acidimicrobiales bacterium]|jgi:uracil phosphoribosyltransferase